MSNTTLEQVLIQGNAKRPKQAVKLTADVRFNQKGLGMIAEATDGLIQGQMLELKSCETIAAGFDLVFWTEHKYDWRNRVAKPTKIDKGDKVAEKFLEVYTAWATKYDAFQRAKGKDEAQAKSNTSTQWQRIRAESEIPAKKQTSTQSQADQVKGFMKKVVAVWDSGSELNKVMKSKELAQFLAVVEGFAKAWETSSK